MNEENNFGGILPDEIDYIPQTPANPGVQNVAAPVLDDFSMLLRSRKTTAPRV